MSENCHSFKRIESTILKLSDRNTKFRLATYNLPKKKNKPSKKEKHCFMVL